MRYHVKLSKIQGYAQMENDGDEIYIMHNKQKVFPDVTKYVRIASTNIPVNINAAIEIDQLQQWIELELWEYNVLMPNMFLGTFKIFASEVGGPFIAELGRKEDVHTRYQLEWEVQPKRITAGL